MADSSAAFALGSAEAPRSLIWRVHTKDDEVHLLTQAANGEIELVAYPAGRWRIVVGGTISRWHRPKEFRPGWTRGPDVILPAIGPVAAVAPGGKNPPPIRWLDLPATGQLARIQLWFGNPHADESRWWSALPRSTRRLLTLPLRKAGTVHLVRSDEAADRDEADRSPSTPDREVVIRADPTGRPSFWETVA